MQMQDTHASPSLSPYSPSHSFASDGNLCFIPYISENCKIYILQGRLSAPAGIAHIKLLLLLGNLNLLSLAINLNAQIDIHFKPPYQYLKRVSDTFRIKDLCGIRLQKRNVGQTYKGTPPLTRTHQFE